MSVLHQLQTRPRSIRSKLPKELADKPAFDQSVNPAHPVSGAANPLKIED